ncbi:proliferation marker protein Ki-67 isoform X5 [Cyprinodon tularosa]|uniref:proliferation marker protein Ki-67 isoform X5 n=1 Tax=Cyprinodon tularosa TaxID=77115 RepID=UPI0018E27D54|nr:proliferation marker protein Ki-67 isoform X5 [Cyprinodon tularosa]
MFMDRRKSEGFLNGASGNFGKMPLHGKIVVIKRSGADGTEFPLTASCLFGRKPECDIRIQVPEVSKEHCRIDLNENKEIILTNLSSVNPTRINGETLHQSERLKHGDMITIVDRSFRFEYAHTATPRKRATPGPKSETLKVLQDQQRSDSVAADGGQKRISTGPHLKDGANYDNIQRSLEKTLEMESQKDGTNSPFGELCQMAKKSLDLKTPQKSSVSAAQTPSSKFYTPRPGPVGTPQKEVKLPADPTAKVAKTPESVKKLGKIFQSPSFEGSGNIVQEDSKSGPASKLRRSVTPQRFTAAEAIEQITATTSKSPLSTKAEGQAVITYKKEKTPKKSPKNLGSAEKVKVAKKRKSDELGKDLPMSNMKRKRVSFGGHLSPELFDKRLPPDSPLRKGAAPRRSLSLYKPKQSLLRRASAIGLLKGQRNPSPKSGLKKNASPGKALPKSKSPSPAKKSPKSKSTSPKATSPGKMSPKTPKSRSASPKAETPAPKTPKSRSASPKVETPAQKTPKSRSASPKAETPAPKTPKSRSASPKVETPAQKTPKSRSASPKAETPAPKTPKSRSASPKVETPAQKTPKSRSASPKAETPAPKTPKPRSASPKAETPAPKTPKSRSASPKVETPAQKTPKSRSASPKVETPAQKTPKSRSASPKAETPAPKTPKPRSASPKAETPALKTPKSRSASPKAETPAKTPFNSEIQSRSVQGRFSISRIKTPSPAAELIKQPASVTVTPKIPLRRKSMKSTRKTPSVSKSALKVLQRRSGISRASIKVVPSSWANVVKFGQTKTSVVAPTEKKIKQKPMKKVMSKLQTPARKLKGHASTGHAESPATIVVGRAHQRAFAPPTGAAPKVVMNAAFSKRDMKMDEDLTGLPEMFKTPINERRRRSLVSNRSAKRTPARSSMMEPSVLKTPEEPDEMMVSPLSVASTVKSLRYNSEAVERLLAADQESSFVSNTPALEFSSESEPPSVKTPQQNPELPERLSGIKRTTKTPKLKAEPIEDLRGKLLKTPKQKPEQQECLTGVKRVMKTPKQKAEPLEDIRGKLLVTPKQKAEQQECLTGVKRIFKTPKQKAEPIEDLRGKLLKTPRARRSGEISLEGVKELLQTPTQQPQMLGLIAVESMIKLPEGKSAPLEDVVEVKRVKRTPKQKGKPVEDNFGLKRLMKSPRARGNPPVEDFEGLQELMEEPAVDLTEQQTTEASGAVETRPEGDAGSIPQQPGVEPSAVSVTESFTTSTCASEKKSARSRRTKPVEEIKEVTEPSQDAITVSVPARGRRGKKAEAAAPPAVRHTTRGRNAEGSQTSVEESCPEPAKVAAKPRRGRNVRKTQEVSAELEQNAFEEEPMIDPNPATDVDSKAPVEEPVLKPKRGRRVKEPEEEAAPLQQNLPEKADESENIAVETVIQLPETLKLPDQEKEDPEAGVKKPVRGRRAKPMDAESAPEPTGHSDEPVVAPLRGRRGRKVEVTSAPDQEKEDPKAGVKKPVRGTRSKPADAEKAPEPEEHSDEPVVAPVRGRRGRKVEATAPPAVKQSTRTRNAKPQDADQPAENSTEAVADLTSENSNETSKEEVTPAQETTTKPLRGRKTKVTPSESVRDACPAADSETSQTVSSVGKTRIGRKNKADDPTEVEDDTALPVENKRQTLPLRAKRARNAVQEEEAESPNEKVTPEETSDFQEPPKKSQRTRNPEQEQTPKADSASKRRGGRKTKPDPVTETPVKSTEPHSDVSEKPKRGRKAAETTQEIIPADNPLPEASAPSPQCGRARGRKNEFSETVPAERGRRGAALPPEEPAEESSSQASEPAPEPVLPVKRGRRAATKPKDDKKAVETNGEPSENVKAKDVDPKTTKKSVRFNSEMEVCEIQKVTPVKSVRGRRSKSTDQADASSNDGAKEANNTEEENLSDDLKAQPAKRARRGAKVAEGAPPKTRRGRSAKK